MLFFLGESLVINNLVWSLLNSVVSSFVTDEVGEATARARPAGTPTPALTSAARLRGCVDSGVVLLRVEIDVRVGWEELIRVATVPIVSHGDEEVKNAVDEPDDCDVVDTEVEEEAVVEGVKGAVATTVTLIPERMFRSLFVEEQQA